MKPNKKRIAEIKGMPLIFVRHDMDSTRRIYRRLIDDNLVALHYAEDLKRKERGKGSGRVVVPEHFKENTAGYRVMKRLSMYCKDGAVVAADYSMYSPDIPETMLIGIIPPGSKPKTKRIKPCKPDEGEVNTEDYPDGTRYSIVKLKDAVKFDYAEYGILKASQTRKQGNVTKWEVGGIDQWIKNLYTDKLHLRKISPNVHLLTTDQLEVLCSEYLRSVLTPSDLRIEYFLTPVGRGTKGTDIDGENKNRHILGQVSFSVDDNEIIKKIKHLQSYENEYGGQKKLVLVYFGPEKQKPPKSQLGNVRYIPIEKVFKKIRAHKRGILESMLPFCKCS